MDIRQIDDKELIELLELYYIYINIIDTTNNYGSAMSLLEKLRAPNAIAIGLFKDGKLSGFILGTGQGSGVFEFTDMYVLPDSRYYVLKLLIWCEGFIRPKYQGWTADALTEDSIRMFSKFKARRVKIKYYKDL